MLQHHFNVDFNNRIYHSSYMQVDYVPRGAYLDCRLPPFFFIRFSFFPHRLLLHPRRGHAHTSSIPLRQGPRPKADRQTGRLCSLALACPGDRQHTYPITCASTSSRGRFEFRQRDIKSSMLTAAESHELVSAPEARAVLNFQERRSSLRVDTSITRKEERKRKKLTVATTDSSQPCEGAPAV